MICERCGADPDDDPQGVCGCNPFVSRGKAPERVPGRIPRGEIDGPRYIVVKGEFSPLLGGVTQGGYHETREAAVEHAKDLARKDLDSRPYKVWEITFKADVTVRRDPPTVSEHDS